ncbi:MAG: PDZ domain-containing protein [Calditrichaeota bacterium]|nr:MAG: PDZ domain-containing protein [Calditrichota bacterium]
MRKNLLFYFLILFSLFSSYQLYKTYPLWALPSFDDDAAREVKKLQEVVALTNAYYVDTLDWKKTITKGIEGMLSSMDPHSHYFSAEEGKANDERFDARYQGVGIEFDILDEKITVIAVIPGAPAQKAGLQSGDRIVEIEGKNAVGLKRDEVPRLLKGPKGSSVKVGVERIGYDELLYFTIDRDEIPIFTINTWFMANDTTGYVWVNRFAATTTDELESALVRLERKGMKQLVLDLRGNGGGYLSEAVKMVAKFVNGHELVVYTRGRRDENNREYFTDDYGPAHTRDIPLVVLINQASASASEIVSGALQDYDRALITGEHSFGKGLVQNEFNLTDGARLRLTVSKYYTPSGRLIQRSYKDKSVKDYFKDAYDTTGAVYDSTGRPKFRTRMGRIVYGGGGIMPDHLQKLTTVSRYSEFTQKLLTKRIFFLFATDYVYRHKSSLDDAERFYAAFRLNKAEWQRFKRLVKKQGLSPDAGQLEKDRRFLENRIKAAIARNLWSEKGYWRVILEYDNQYDTALTLFPEYQELVKKRGTTHKN